VTAEEIMADALETTVARLVRHGVPEEVARQRLREAWNAPPAVPLPTLEDLDAMADPEDDMSDAELDAWEEAEAARLARSWGYGLTPQDVFDALETAHTAPSMEITADTPDAVVDQFLFGDDMVNDSVPVVELTEPFEDLPKGAHGTLLYSYPERNVGVVEFDSAEPVRVEDTPNEVIDAIEAELDMAAARDLLFRTDAELQAMQNRGDDPDNPPLRDGASLASWKERAMQRAAAHVQRRMRRRAIKRLESQGMAPEDAERLADAALNCPPCVPLPTLDDLERDERAENPFPIVQLTQAIGDLAKGARGTLLDSYPEHNVGVVEFSFDSAEPVRDVPLDKLARVDPAVPG
jgi:hypothetical protein